MAAADCKWLSESKGQTICWNTAMISSAISGFSEIRAVAKTVGRYAGYGIAGAGLNMLPP